MSIKAVEWAFKQELPHTRKFVLVALAEFANAGGECFPSQTTVARRCGIARQTVNVAIANLKKEGLIECSTRHRMNGSDTSCEYKMMMNLTADPVTEDHTPCHRGRHPLSSSKTPPVSQDDTHNRNLTVSITKRNITKKRSPQFDDFWTQYPKKVGKGAARKSYARALKITSHEEIMAGLSRYMPDPQYTCNPATWLNQERWTDEHTHHESHRQEGKRTSADRLRSALAGAARAFDR